MMLINSKQTDPKVSILCPSYNHAPYLRQALDSILMQKVDFPLEVLVGEDCSPDDSRKILREYEEKHPEIFQMFYRDVNLGATKNGHDLRMRAKGKYLITLETDDYWTDPTKLQKQVDFLEENPQYIGCAHACQLVDESGCPTGITVPELLTESRCVTLQDFLKEGFIFQTATLMHRNIFLDGGDYSIICKAHGLVGDVTILSLLLQRGNICLFRECMSAYRRVIKPEGTSAASLGKANLADSLLSSMKQYVELEKYFQGKINYSPQKIYPVERYFSGLIRREDRFTLEGMAYMWRAAGIAVRWKTVCFVLGYPIRKIKEYVLKSF